MVTPPVGMNLHVIKSVVGDQVELENIFRGCLWFLVCDFVVVTVVIAFPQTDMYLPGWGTERCCGRKLLPQSP